MPHSLLTDVLAWRESLTQGQRHLLAADNAAAAKHHGPTANVGSASADRHDLLIGHREDDRSAPGPPGRVALGQAQGRVQRRGNGCAQVLLQLRRSPMSLLALPRRALQVGELLLDLLKRQDAP